MTTPSDFRPFVASVKARAARVVVAVLAVSVLVLTACKEPREVTLGLSWLHSSQYCGSYYADQHGLYASEGLHAKLRAGQPQARAANVEMSSPAESVGARS